MILLAHLLLFIIIIIIIIILINGDRSLNIGGSLSLTKYISSCKVKSKIYLD